MYVILYISHWIAGCSHTVALPISVKQYKWILISRPTLVHYNISTWPSLLQTICQLEFGHTSTPVSGVAANSRTRCRPGSDWCRPKALLHLTSLVIPEAFRRFLTFAADPGDCSDVLAGSVSQKTQPGNAGTVKLRQFLRHQEWQIQNAATAHF